MTNEIKLSSVFDICALYNIKEKNLKITYNLTANKISAWWIIHNQNDDKLFLLQLVPHNDLLTLKMNRWCNHKSTIVDVLVRRFHLILQFLFAQFSNISLRFQ